MSNESYKREKQFPYRFISFLQRNYFNEQMQLAIEEKHLEKALFMFLFHFNAAWHE